MRHQQIKASLVKLYHICKKYLDRNLRRIWNILTLSEISRAYPDVALRRLWLKLPSGIHSLRPVHAFGKFVFKRTYARQPRVQSQYTRFLRNLPLLKVLQHLILQKPQASSLRLAVIGCSTGAELYSALWIIRSARPDLDVAAVGIDISGSVVEKARIGIYAYSDKELEYVLEETIDSLFVRDGDSVKVQEWIRAGVSWRVEDARNPQLLQALGPQDVVMANNFLIHMSDVEAEACLLNIIRLIRPGGYIFTYGINLDVKTRVVRTYGLVPIRFKIEEIHNADRSIYSWPLDYWGLEPFDKSRPDWDVRYATVFQVPPHKQG
jgi:hypothetical protein